MSSKISPVISRRVQDCHIDVSIIPKLGGYNETTSLESSLGPSENTYELIKKLQSWIQTERRGTFSDQQELTNAHTR